MESACEGVTVLELERVKQLGDDVLIERLTRSVQRDRQLSVELLIELSEVQERGLFRDLGFATMFDYATRRLGMSESEAALLFGPRNWHAPFRSRSRCWIAARSI